MKQIRKISIGSNYKTTAMHYSVGQVVYDNHTITDIIENNGSYDIYISKMGEIKPWKTFNSNMAVTVEYDLEY